MPRRSSSPGAVCPTFGAGSPGLTCAAACCNAESSVSATSWHSKRSISNGPSPARKSDGNGVRTTWALTSSKKDWSRNWTSTIAIVVCPCFGCAPLDRMIARR